MLIARSKKQENIIEYLIYMFQIEELVRASELDVEKIYHTIIQPQIKDEKLALEYKAWYSSIINELNTYNKQKVGHINDVTEVQVELFYLHNSLLNLMNDEKYRTFYDAALPFIKEFRDKSNAAQLNDVDMAIQALYTKLLLRLKGSEISEASEEAFDAMRKMLAYLAKAYHKMKSGDLNFINN